MTERVKDFPVFVKLSIITMGVLAFSYILYIGQGILIPLIFSTIIAILLNPVVNFFTGKGINRIVAISLVLFATIILLGALTYFIYSRLDVFTESFPQLKEKFSALFSNTVNQLSDSLHISKTKIHSWIEKIKVEGMNSGTVVIGQTLLSIGSVFVLVLLIPVYVFMILFYKPLLLEFISQLFQKNKQPVVAEVLSETKTLVQSYLVGLMLEAAIVAALNSAGLLIIGLDYAILLGIIGGLLNIIPYVGGLVATALPMLIALATKSPLDAFWVLLIYAVVQFVDNNFLVPKIVGSKVKINALVSIVVVIIGGALWGVAGMFLSIPITAIIKVVFDRIEPLKPIGFVIGDDQPAMGDMVLKFKGSVRKKKATVRK